jgi:predicted Zn-dependent protease with MMP-like domain
MRRAMKPRGRFLRLVRRSLAELPAPFRERLSNVDVVVERRPGLNDLREAGLSSGETLYGLYSGVPLTERSDYGFVLPDKITIFQEPLERDFPDEAELVKEVRKTVLHEIAHHFGIPDDKLAEMGMD